MGYNVVIVKKHKKTKKTMYWSVGSQAYNWKKTPSNQYNKNPWSVAKVFI